MASFYLILVVVLFLLAISDLVVGVSNDAVNFLNSAVGAKAAAFKVIMTVAALGVLVGATFSSGMMEVARKGIFHPEFFYFSEIIILFLAVMVTDVILLDTFNTFGMPTSTTVSIVFELLGAAVAIAAVKIFTDPNALALYEYINSAKALAIISGILLSVVIAFTCGVLVQYLSRLLFSFDYEKRMRQYGAIWGGLGVMAITYFMLIKGVKGASFMSVNIVTAVGENTIVILLGSFVGWTLILYLLNRVFKVNILQVLVLVGTFALAMAFAGNDLVNFIGVPLAGYNSYLLFTESGSGADQLLMDGLAGKVPTPTLLLLLAGLIMVITLYTSRKAKSVVKTSLDLGRQDEGQERFSSFVLSRRIVRNFASAATAINNALPEKWTQGVKRQFDHSPFTKRQRVQGKEAPVFDMIRASVTLVVASILIAIGTNLKLPLSTTYVTFMVFMGTSLADGAWGRESAVYRVSGVLSVIGGWFFTAFSAFIVAFAMALIFHFGGLIAISITLVIAGILIYRTHRYHGKRLKEQVAFEKSFDEGTLTGEKLVSLSHKQLKTFLIQFETQVDSSLKGLKEENLNILNHSYQTFRPVLGQVRRLKTISSNFLDRVPESDLEAGHLYILVVDYLYEMGKLTMDMIENNLNHVDNNHKPLLPEQMEELMSLHDMLRERYQSIIEVFKTSDQELTGKLYDHVITYVNIIRNVRKKQIKRIKNHEVGTRNSALYLGHLGELRNLGLFSNRIVRVLDELILNPHDDGEFSVDRIKRELKQLRKEVKTIPLESDKDLPKASGEGEKT
ncbi:MAG: inorganic phosphate transporter [Cyclobacteriaceae bacterium]|nr:inorganic phosphate transporter [Cyclobacteriaceae bacterium]